MSATSPQERDLPRLLRPGVALMNRLRYPGKFALISILFVLPLGLVMELLIGEINERIDFAGKELQGAQYLVPVRSLVAQIARSRLAAQDADPMSLERTIVSIEQALGELTVVQRELGSILGTEPLYARLV